MSISGNDPDFAEIVRKTQEKAYEHYQQNKALYRTYGDSINPKKRGDK